MANGTLIAAVLLVVFARSAAHAAPATTNVIRSRAVEFYRWYMAHDDDRRPVFKRADMTTWVTPELARWLRGNSRSDDPLDYDCFLNTQDADLAHWRAHVAAGVPAALPNDPHLLVSIGKPVELELCVHLRHRSGVWKIARVDVDDQPPLPGCRTRLIEPN